MDYKKFENEIVKAVEALVGNEYSVSINRVIKNNGVEFSAINILCDGDHMVPNIYLQYYYEEYQKGSSLERIAQQILCVYEENKNNRPDFLEQYLDLEQVKNHIFYRIVQYEKNRKTLDMVPHERVLDLAVTFHCLVEENSSGIQSFMISKALMKKWGITEKQLYQDACHNTPRLFPAKIKSLEAMLNQWIGDEEISIIENSSECQEADALMENEQMPLYILTNQYGINGAAVLLYPDFLEQISVRFQDDLYILPSSIHELLVLPAGTFDVDDLTKMVEEVNCNVVDAEDVLSDTVYFYSYEDKCLQMC